ncbi:hypothetical protein C4544_01985 [candidate division WS5 bacterium]|uniref:Uncharacterized protein n=1 Tax=candidate division WS5 bacterium TaxID=2093353 RepID=A0A419DF19_9BACT|nr:MAG: hypothetical protein C4544_01985 [candidate division WS5 bacterium]
MESFDEVCNKINTEIISDDADDRAEYLKHFKTDVDKFTFAMATAFMGWRKLDNTIKGDEKRAYVSGLVYTAITLHILSLKLFISGHTVAAGNLMRQVLESIALALLCAGKNLGILEQFMDRSYRSNNAIRDVMKHYKILELKEPGVRQLSEAQKFYHQYSHPTLLTLATGMSDGVLYVGASFDESKIEAYTKEINSRVGLAEVFDNFIYAVYANLSKW